MTTNIRNDIAQFIRINDGRNDLTAGALATVVVHFIDATTDHRISRVEVGDLISQVNPDKRMGAGALADAIVDHFGLDEED